MCVSPVAGAYNRQEIIKQLCQRLEQNSSSSSIRAAKSFLERRMVVAEHVVCCQLKSAAAPERPSGVGNRTATEPPLVLTK